MGTFAPPSWGEGSGPWPNDDPDEYDSVDGAIAFSLPGHDYVNADFRMLVAAIRKFEPAEIWMSADDRQWNVEIGYSKSRGELRHIYFDEIHEAIPGPSDASTAKHDWISLNLESGKFRTARGTESRTLPKPFDQLPQGPSPSDA